MKYLQALLICFLFLSSSMAQNFHRNAGETAAEFASSILPNDSARLVGQVLETNDWDSTKKLIIAFYAATVQMTAPQKEAFNQKAVLGFVFVPLADGQYKRMLIDTFMEAVSRPYIESVFFANADKDKAKELVILCSWNLGGFTSRIAGKVYHAFLYDHLNFAKLPERIKVLHHLDKTFKPEFDGVGDGAKKSIAKYKSAEEIKKKLKALRY